MQTGSVLVIVFSVLAVAALGWFVLRRHRSPVPGTDETVTTVAQVPHVVAALRGSAAHPAFVVFMFVPAGARPDDVVNLQFSVEQGVLGLDWVLIAPRNVSDRAQLEKFITDRGHAVVEHLVKDTRYLRVEDERVTQLGVAILCEFYGLASDARLDLVVEGFDWNPSRS